MAQNGTRAAGPRCIALVGPFQSGKTSLLEAILARTGAIPRQGTIEAGNTVGDSSKEARSHRMSVEISVASTTFMGDAYTLIDCPGSVEFVHEMRAALPAVDAAVIVCELDEKRRTAAIETSPSDLFSYVPRQQEVDACSHGSVWSHCRS